MFEILAMDNIPEVTPHKKKKKNYFNFCIIYQSYNSRLEITKSAFKSNRPEVFCKNVFL